MFTNDAVEAIYLIKCPISPTANPSCVVETEDSVQYNRKSEKGKINNTLLKRVTVIKYDSTLAAINKLEYFVTKNMILQKKP